MKWEEWHRHCDVALDHYWPSDNMSEAGASASRQYLTTGDWNWGKQNRGWEGHGREQGRGEWRAVGHGWGGITNNWVSVTPRFLSWGWVGSGSITLMQAETWKWRMATVISRIIIPHSVVLPNFPLLLDRFSLQPLIDIGCSPTVSP